MLRALRAMALGFIAVEVSALTLNVQPAFAQSPAYARLVPGDTEITASDVTQYSGYYAPYAIQAAAAYLKVKKLDDMRRARLAQEEKAPPTQATKADVNYAVENIFSFENFGSLADEIKPGAIKALEPWRYEFGSDAYLSCYYYPTDRDCNSALPTHWRYRPPAGPAFQVWARTVSLLAALFEPGSCDEVSIAFRGTSRKWDWASNFRRFGLGKVRLGHVVDDSYRQLRRNIDLIIRRITTLDCYKRATFAPRIVSVGHSLGGGLAQLAALANKPTGPQIEKVFAFDPSPVTGADLVDRQTLEANSKGLTIDRIHQIGEGVSYLGLAQGFPPSNNPCDPLVRTVSVDALRGNPVELHGMPPLAAQLIRLSYQGITQKRPTSKCETRYDRPHPGGEEGTPVADLGGRCGSSLRPRLRGLPIWACGERPMRPRVRRSPIWAWCGERPMRPRVRRSPIWAWCCKHSLLPRVRRLPT